MEVANSSTLTVNKNAIRQTSKDINSIKMKYNNLGTDPNYHPKWKIQNILIMIPLHLGMIYGLYLTVTLKPKIFTLIWACFIGLASTEGIILGTHRGFSHKAFKLTTADQILLLVLQTMSGQGPAYAWARDHRLHHKYESTDADPYNVTRGLFFSHIGWLMSYKHPLVIKKRNAHYQGERPYDRRFTAREFHFPYFTIMEEQSHNYHHAFPYDHAFNEFGLQGFGILIFFLRFLQSIGWVYDMKVVSESVISKHSMKYGDRSFILSESDIKAKRVIPKNNSW